MGFLDFLQFVSKASDVNSPSYPNLVYNKINKTLGVPAGKSSADYQDLYSVQADIYRAVQVKATSIAQLSKKVKIKRVIQGKDDENVTDKPEFNIFKKPNPYQSRYDFWEATMGYLEMTGECPWLLEIQGKKIISMFPIRPDLITVYPHNEFLISHYEFNRNGEKIVIPPENIFFLKYFNPNNHLRGLSPLAAATNDIILDLQAVNAGKKTFSAGARPSGVLTPEDDDMEDPEYNMLIQNIRDQYSGTDNYGKIMALNKGMKWQQLQYSNEELQILDIRKDSSKTIQKVYGVPPVYFMDFSDSSVLANATEQVVMLWNTLLPVINKMEETFTEFLLPRITSDPNVVFDFDTTDVRALQPDKEIQTKTYSEGIKSAAVSPNEMRIDVFGKEADPDPMMDMKFITNGLTPITDLGFGDEENSEPEKTFISSVNNLVKSSPKDLVQQIKDATLNIQDRMDKAEFNAYVSKSISRLQPIINKYMNKFTKVQKSLFRDQRNDILNKLATQKNFKVKTLTVESVFDFKKWVKIFKSKGKPHIAAALEEAAKEFSNSIGETFIVSDPIVAKNIGTRVNNYATLSNQTTKDKIDNILRIGQAEGLSISEIGSIIEQYFDNQSFMRANRIARTEIVGSTNLGRLSAMRQSGRIEKHMWMTQRDDNVRDSHSGVDGITRKLGESFPVGGDYAGDDTYPSDINERCYTIPVKIKKKPSKN